ASPMLLRLSVAGQQRAVLLSDLSECQEEAQQIYFHKWSFTANTIMLRLIFIKETFRNCFEIISIAMDAETEKKRKKEARKRERWGKKEKGRGEKNRGEKEG
ncbi:hypothetical protein ATANTOWER_025883, partial [Ataeniobius toweri]|nr:hypothetical protein [Ataeniobius toweri]